MRPILRFLGLSALITLGYLMALIFHWSLTFGYDRQIVENRHYGRPEGGVFVVPLRVENRSLTFSMQPVQPPISYDLFGDSP